MSRRFSEQRNNPGWEQSSRNRRGNGNRDYDRGWNEPRQSRHEEDWRPFDSQDSFGQRNYGRMPYDQQGYGERDYRDNDRQWNEQGWNQQNRNEQRWNEPGYRTTQDYSDMGQGNDRGWNEQRRLGNPYRQQDTYRPYESGYDAPQSSMAREHYQPSAMGNSERYGYRDDADYNRYQQRGNYQGNYGSQQSYGSQQQGGYGGWQERGNQQGEYGSQGSSQREGRYRGVGPRNYQRSDQRIMEDINDRLNDHPYIDASDVQVKVKDGEVTLEGTVDSRWTKHHVEDIADEVSGVKDVENRIHIKKNIWEKENSNTEKTSSADSKNKLAERGAN